MKQMTTEQKQVLLQLKEAIANLTPKAPPIEGKLTFVQGEKEVFLKWHESTLVAAAIWTADHRKGGIRRGHSGWSLSAFGFEQKFETADDLFSFLTQQV